MFTRRSNIKILFLLSSQYTFKRKIKDFTAQDDVQWYRPLKKKKDVEWCTFLYRRGCNFRGQFLDFSDIETASLTG